jgi:fatty-acyl-CoA synthase
VGIWRTATHLAGKLGLKAVFALRPTGAGDARPDLEGFEYLEDAAAGQRPDRLLAEPPVATDIAAYFHTGGTTGAPKLAAHTQANQVVMAWSIAANRPRGEDLATLAGLPLFHVNALLVTALMPLFLGQHVVWAGPLGYRDPALFAAFWRIVERYRVENFSAVPTVYAVLARVPIDADISALRFGVVGAAPLPNAVRDAFETHTGVPLCEGYGLTEGTCASARNYPDQVRRGSVGQRLPYQRIKAVEIDPGTGAARDLPTGEVGILFIAGPTVFAGYVHSGHTLDSDGKVVDGWLDTGDLGRVDEDGYVYLQGREKDLIIRGGHNIDPRSIEDALLAHPEVADAAAVGRPDRRSGEVPVVYVTRTAGSKVSAEALRDWAAEHVPERAAAPKDVIILDALPVTEVGKQFKPALRLDAIRRVVAEELDALGMAEECEVGYENGEAVVRLGKPADHADTLAGVLDNYQFTWHFSG